MEKRCYVCGKKIEDNDFHYNVGVNSYVCSNNKCYDFYYWDNLATQMIHDPYHEYVIVDRKVYQIGSDKDEPRGFGGRIWHIHFLDGTNITTNSLWLRGDLPQRLLHDFNDNAIFVEEF